MEIRQLKYFVGIAECGSFSEASRRFYLSQSAISQQIKALEEELKTSLFIRNPHHMELTESGQMLLPLAQRVLQNVQDCTDRMTDIGKMLCGQLNIGLTHSLEPYIRKTMIRFMKLYPNVQLCIFYKTIPELIEMLRSNQLDLAFSIKVENEEDWVESTPFVEYHLCAFMRDTHPLANRSILSFADIRPQSLILPERSLRNRNAIEDFLSREGNEMKVRATINDAGAIMNLLRAGNYISILSERNIKGQEEICAIPIKELTNPVVNYAHLNKGVHHKRSALEFIRLAIEVAKCCE